MYELQIMNLEQTDVSLWDFERLRTELQKGLESYEGLVYTDETIKDAKTDRTALSKVKKVIETARKQYKAKCLAPYEAVEPKIKELIQMVDSQRSLIDDTVKEYEARKKAEKEQEIRSYYDCKAIILGDLADRLYPKLFNQKWLNTSAGRPQYEEEVLTAIHKAAEDIESIKRMDSPFSEVLTGVYAETLSLESVRSKNEELTAAVTAAGLVNQNRNTEIPAPPMKDEVRDRVPASEGQGVAMRIYAGTTQMNQICDFMKAIGVRYELI